MKLFKIINGDIEINKTELLISIPFRTIIRRDTHRNKYKAFNELCYIYYIADLKSLPNLKGYTKTETHVYALEKSGLDINWKPDKVVLDAIELYKDTQSNLSKSTINELLKTFRFIDKVIRKVRVSIEELLVNDKLTKDQALEVIGLIETVIKLGKDVPMLSKELNIAVSELYEEEETDVDLMRGTKERVPNSANPDSDY